MPSLSSEMSHKMYINGHQNWLPTSSKSLCCAEESKSYKVWNDTRVRN